MRKLFLLRGIPGCGKSTFLKQCLYDNPNHAGLVISADDVRLMFSPCVYPKDDFTHKSINPENDKQVWELIHKLVKERLEKGYTTIVDATHCNVNSIDYYKSFCSENSVDCCVVQFDVDLKTCKERNSQRPKHRRVPDSVLDRMYENMKIPVPNWCSTITTEQFECMLKFFVSNKNDVFKMNVYTDFMPLDYDKFNQIVVFGDIHGCYEPLKQFFEKYPINNETKYIFVGDYEDRGIQNKEVFEFLLSHKRDGNFLFLKGNHTQHTLAFADNKPVVSREFRERTAKQLEGIDKKELKKFCLRQGAFSYFCFCNQEFLITHGGVPTFPNSFTNEKELVNGVGKYEDSVIIDEMFRKQYPFVVTIHGHRNIQEVSLNDGMKTGAFNLEGQIEFGGYLRAIIISKGKNCPVITPVEIKNDVYRDINSNKDIIDQLKNSRFIRQKPLDDGIVSYSFTKECFYDKRWDNLTTKARGLFCRGENIVARSFEKFFNIGEKQSLEKIADTFVYPVSVYKKENGYLGIVSFDNDTNKLFVSSKSTNCGEYAEFFKDYLIKHKVYEKLEKFLKGSDLSLVFEVCTEKDPHIVKYDKDTIFLLEAFHNTFKQNTVDYDTLKIIADDIDVQVKHKSLVLDNKTDFLSFIYVLEGELGKKLFNTEGYVLEDTNHFRVKYKTWSYRFWKYVRNKGGKVSLKDDLKNFPLFEKEIKQIETVVNEGLDMKQFIVKNLIGSDVFSVIKFREYLDKN